jgi:hypothetical protein
MKWGMAIALFLTLAAAGGPVVGAAQRLADTVEFVDCVETIGVGLVPTQRARMLVPDTFSLAGEGAAVTPFVVRTARCRTLAVGEHKPKRGAIVQIGVVVVPPDFTGDINIFTIWYYTSDAKLAHDLSRLGVPAQHVPTIVYSYEPGEIPSSTPFFFAAPRPGRPTLSLDGAVVDPQGPAGSFVANWWAQAAGATVKMTTTVPQIAIGDADLMLTTNPDGPLGQLIVGEVAPFPVLQQFNTFPAARMEVSVHRN